MSKSNVFALCFTAILGIFTAAFVFSVLKGTFDAIPVGECLTAIVSLAGLYFTGAVVNNGVKGKYWNQQMYDAENHARHFQDGAMGGR